MVRYLIYFGVKACLSFVFASQDERSNQSLISLANATEAFPEISTASLISITFALATKNDDVAALIALYMTVNMLVVLTIASYLA